MRIRPGESKRILHVFLKRNGSEHKAARVMKNLRYLFSRAMKFRVLTYNPALAFQVSQPKARTQKWTPDQVDKAINTAWEHGYHGAAASWCY